MRLLLISVDWGFLILLFLYGRHQRLADLKNFIFTRDQYLLMNLNLLPIVISFFHETFNSITLYFYKF